MDLALSIAFVALLAIVGYIYKETVDIKKKYELRGVMAKALEKSQEQIIEQPKEQERCVTQIGKFHGSSSI